MRKSFTIKSRGTFKCESFLTSIECSRRFRLTYPTKFLIRVFGGVSLDIDANISILATDIDEAKHIAEQVANTYRRNCGWMLSRAF
jgi:hypothetical protein